MPLVVDKYRTCLETVAQAKLAELGVELTQTYLYDRAFLDVALYGWDYLATYGEAGMKERLERSGAMASADQILVALKESPSSAAAASHERIYRNVATLVPKVVYQYPLGQEQLPVAWEDKSLGRLGVATMFIGIKAINSDIEARRRGVLKQLNQRVSRHNQLVK